MIKYSLKYVIIVKKYKITGWANCVAEDARYIPSIYHVWCYISSNIQIFLSVCCRGHTGGKTLRRRNCVAEKAIYIPTSGRPRKRQLSGKREKSGEG